MLQACGLLKEPTPASPSPPARIAGAAPLRATTASEYETDILVNENCPLTTREMASHLSSESPRTNGSIARPPS